MTVEAYDIGTYIVESETNPDLSYIVDLSEMTCTCPHYMDFGKATRREPCKHLEAVIHYSVTHEHARNHPANPTA